MCDGGVVTNAYFKESDKFLTFARQDLQQKPELLAKIAERRVQLTIPSPEPIEESSGEEGDDKEDEEEEVFEIDSDWDASTPPGSQVSSPTPSTTDGHSSQNWENIFNLIIDIVSN